MSRSPLSLVAGVAVAAALLAGCGGTSPGVAVQVGEESISINEVDELTDQYCRAIEKQLEANAETVPHRYFRAGIAGQLTLRSVAEQLAAEYDVEPGPVYDEKVAQLEQGVSALDEDVQDAVVQVESATAYVEAVEAAVGERLLAAEDASAAELSDQVARGKVALEEWVSEHDVTFDPQLGVSLVKGSVEPVDSSLSFAVSDAAVAGSAENPDPTYARSLPDPHRCG